ncbi:thymidylate kinase [Rahnella woolbedingensis]|uniref:Thymidylate kinase n=1 Tax=Rahnella woolbedingensis TaxID=1510574 RepID=A0A419NBB7_9GAMM|nr:thymidylate kinase [Rahnella woolbedingensis]RJT45194.1 thymidylate kinase [Rahnella woolbedingensis]
MDSTLPPPLIAVIGSDGSGKSTVCEHLIICVNEYGPAAAVHLGKQAGNVERQVIKIPILGGILRKSIERNKVSVAKSGIGPLPALVVISFVVRRLLRFRRMLALRQRGLIILSDRFPQIQIPGAYDGILLPQTVPGRPFVTWLAGRERAAFEWMASHKPDLVIKLNVDLDVACARKPDHRRESLAKKVLVTSKLTFQGSQIIDINANDNLESVLDAAKEAVSRFMESRGYSRNNAEKPVVIS